jgi:hypothetical protein
LKLSEVYDRNTSHLGVGNYPQDESMCMITQREYREELEARVREGDIYAKSALERIDSERS